MIWLKKLACLTALSNNDKLTMIFNRQRRDQGCMLVTSAKTGLQRVHTSSE